MTTTLERPDTVTPVEDEAAPRRDRSRLWLGCLLVATAVAYLWGLSANGYANEFYAMATQAGSTSWEAWFFGSLDASSAITVDKTPASLWVMGLSGRIFGFSSWSMLVPQALMGVASVGLLYATVRRWFSPAAGLIAGAVLASTPVAVLMFRFNNPDALLVLLMVGAAYAVTRAVESRDRALRWLVLGGALIGFAFLAKMMQTFLVLPGFVAAYAVAGQARPVKRLLHLLAAFAAMVVAGGWWIAIVELIPASARPYIGGSQGNSILELTLGYNGLGRLNGDETGSVGGGGVGAGGGQWGSTGPTRMFDSESGTQISWLLPAALVALVVLAVLSARAARTDRMRAFVLVWGGWLLTTGLTFSLMAGIFHSYYTVALAPAIGALVGVGTVSLWRRRDDIVMRAVLAGTILVTAAWSYALLLQTAAWQPWIRYVVLTAGAVATALVLLGRETTWLAGRRVALATATAITFVAFLGPVASSSATIATAHTGSLPSAGPTQSSSRPGGAGGGGGILGGGGTDGVSSDLVAMLQEGDYTWGAAAQTSNGASPLALASGEPILAIGGFNGTDPYPDLATFQDLVASGEIHYYVASTEGAGGRGVPGGGSNDEITTWVEQTFTATAVDDYTVFDLTSTTSQGATS